MRYKRRRSKGTWMPVLGQIVEDAENKYHYSDIVIPATKVAPSNAAGGVDIFTIPIIPDFTHEESSSDPDNTASLHDRVSGNAWLLQRIVGKLNLKCYTSGALAPEVAWANVLVTVGFLVARALDNAVNSIDLTPVEHDPQQVDNAQNPWIWRRTWVLGSAGSDQAWSQQATSDYHSVADGPHIDSKVKRYIQREHRLWMTIRARGFDPRVFVDVSGSPEQQPAIGGNFDYRVFGGLRRQKNSSSF